jgi:hypothetical protein
MGKVLQKKHLKKKEKKERNVEMANSVSLEIVGRIALF